MVQGGGPVKYPLHFNKGCLGQGAGNGVISCEDSCVTRLNSFIAKGIVKGDVVVEGVQVAATFSSDRSGYLHRAAMPHPKFCPC